MNEQKITEALKEISDLRNVNVGDNVWTDRCGWGVIDEINTNLNVTYPISVGVPEGKLAFTLDGNIIAEYKFPSCFTKNPFTYILEKFGNQEKIIEVEIGPKSWYKRTLINVMPNGYACVYSAMGINHFCDSIEKTNDVAIFRNWREVKDIPTFTKEQICKLLNVENFIIAVD